MAEYDIIEVLDNINPSALTYTEWLNVGMALKNEGYGVDTWEQWSSRDGGRYFAGECQKKWNGFHGSSTPVTAGTIVQFARDQGWEPSRSDMAALDWDSVIGSKEKTIIDENWVEGMEVVEPDDWKPAKQLIKYLETLFESSENVGYVTESWEKEGRYLPSKGCVDRTAGELIQELQKCRNDIGKVLGDYNEEAGAWIRFNPLDGAGVKDSNVTDYRYALVESDAIDIDKQNAIIRELELPVACLVHSGKKSLHAIVKIDAADYNEYRKRVDYLYNICQRNGLKIDSQNRNPSRLSRMPGVTRQGHKQYLVDTNIGKESWREWFEWIESVNDDLPEPESIEAVWDSLPDLSPPLIDGVLRQGHKMLLAGPSKAGKSYALIELCCAIAEGNKWFNWDCTKGKVMYVNLELDRASCLHRFKDVYTALGYKPNNLHNIDVWNLRGKSVPMDKLAPKLIRRAAKKNYIAIIIDPIYKVITGDENSADQMAHFCNQFDRVCSELGAAVIYCHHHSKGSQGNKRSMDRASGSGVFARDPDVLLDLIELDLTSDIISEQENKAVCDVCIKWLDKHCKDWDDEISQDDLCIGKAVLKGCRELMTSDVYKDMLTEIEDVKAKIKGRSAWRIEGTLREFPKFAPVNLWFDYPVHNVDKTDVLKDVETEGERPPWQKATDARKKNAKNKKVDKAAELELAILNCKFGEPPTTKELADYLNISQRTARERIKEDGRYTIDRNRNYTIVKSEEAL